MAMALDDAAQHCDELLRSEDKDRWLTACSCRRSAGR